VRVCVATETIVGQNGADFAFEEFRRAGVYGL
jgi:hypothetical protein